MVNGQALTIVGVASPDFHGTTVGERPDFYAPLAIGPTVAGVMQWGADDRRSYYLYVFGRFAPHATMAEAQAAINAVYRPIINDVEAPLQRDMSDSGVEVLSCPGDDAGAATRIDCGAFTAGSVA